MEWGNPWAFLGLLALPLVWWWGRWRLRQSRGLLAYAALGLRAAFLVLMLMALAMPTLRLPESRTDWLILADRSHSLSDAALEFTRELVRGLEADKAPRDRVAVLAFGGSSSLEVPFAATSQEGSEAAGAPGDSGDTEPPGGGSDFNTVNPGGTNLELALRGAMAEFEDQQRQQIILISDGNQTRGQALDALNALRDRGILLDAVIPPAVADPHDVVLENLVLPAVVKVGDTFTVEAIVYAAQPTEAALAFYEESTLVGQYRVELVAGRNGFPITVTAREDGQRLFRADVFAPGDRRPQNNGYQRFVTVAGSTRVLLVAGDAVASRSIAEALKVQNLQVSTVGVDRVPTTAAGLRAYDVVIFDNAPGFSLSQKQMELLAAYVREAGGGFIMTGGEQSFGGGGYQETPLEAMLPVNLSVENEMRLPSVALVLVIDRSDSMGSAVTGGDLGGSKLEVAKLASFQAMQLLNPKDRVGLVAFDTKAHWIVPMVEVAQREAIESQIARLKVGGGTDLYAGLSQAVDQLGQLRAHKKHIIALSDGLTPVRRYEELVKSAAGSRITVSTVALGEGADENLLRNVASWGNGRYYFTTDATKIPRIFTTDTLMAAQGLIEELTFRPALRETHEILEGAAAETLPPLHGYVVTSAKPEAKVLLTGLGDDPVLAVRQYGLGRSVAFTSDLSTAWGRSWMTWPIYPRILTQLVRWAEGRDGDSGMELDVRAGEGAVGVVAELYDDEGRYLNQMTVIAQIESSEETTRQVLLQQEAPGRYRGELPLPPTGEYRVAVTGAGGPAGRQIGPEEVGLAVSYGAEYETKPPNLDLLRDLAAGTGGQLFDGEDAPAVVEVLVTGEGQDPVRRPIWPYFIVAGLLLFLIDIALRQIGWMPRQQEAAGTAAG